MAGSALATAYPSAEEWKVLLEQFDSSAIAHKLLLAHIPYVFSSEPVKYSVFRHTIAESFKIEPTNVFIVGSAMAGRSLKGDALEKEYNRNSDIDVLIVSDRLFTDYVMKSLRWLKIASEPERGEKGKISHKKLDEDFSKKLYFFSSAVEKGIWRPDSLPKDAEARIEFFREFNKMSLKTLGLQLSEDTVAKVNGRIARSFEDAVNNLAQSIYRLKKELKVDLQVEVPVDDEGAD